MKKNRLLLILPLLLLLAAPLGSTARAFDGFYGGRGLGAGLWRHPALFGAYRSSSTLYSLGYTAIPPYFALHPPVYYSLPVRRPYGDSPFAWRSAGFAQRRAVPPRILHNPMFQPTSRSEATPAPNDTAGGPQMIINPFCQSDRPTPGRLAAGPAPVSQP